MRSGMGSNGSTERSLIEIHPALSKREKGTRAIKPSPEQSHVRWMPLVQSLLLAKTYFLTATFGPSFKVKPKKVLFCERTTETQSR